MREPCFGFCFSFSIKNKKKNTVPNEKNPKKKLAAVPWVQDGMLLYLGTVQTNFERALLNQNKQGEEFSLFFQFKYTKFPLQFFTNAKD
jgi:hypothetical protein